MNAGRPGLTLAWMCEFNYAWQERCAALRRSWQEPKMLPQLEAGLKAEYDKLVALFPTMIGTKMVLTSLDVAYELPLHSRSFQMRVCALTDVVPASEIDLVDLAKLFPASSPTTVAPGPGRVFQMVMREVGSDKLTHAQLYLHPDGRASASVSDASTGLSWTEVFQMNPMYSNPLRALWTVLDANLRRLIN